MTNRKKQKKKLMVISGIVIAAVLIIAVYAVFFTSLSLTDAESTLETFDLQAVSKSKISSSVINNCKTVRYKEDVWTGQNSPLSSGYPFKELLNAEMYLTKKTGSSTAILFKGNIYKSASGQSSVSQRAYYNVYVLEMGKNNNQWKKIVGLNYKDTAVVSYVKLFNWFSCKSYPSATGAQTIWGIVGSLTLKGAINGAIKVEFVVEFAKSTNLKVTWQKTMSTDYAYLVS